MLSGPCVSSWKHQSVNVRLGVGGLHIPPQDLQQLSHPVEVLRLINKTAEPTEREAKKRGDKRQETEVKQLKTDEQRRQNQMINISNEDYNLLAERQKTHHEMTR